MELSKKASMGALVGSALATGVGKLLISGLRTKNQAKILQSIMQQTSSKEIPSDYPVEVIPNFTNAFYVRGNSINDKKSVSLQRKAHKELNRGNTPVGQALLALDKFGKTPTGGIVVGQPFYNPTILKHEEGHAADTSNISRLAPKVESFWSRYNVPLLGTAAAIGVGLVSPENSDLAHTANIVLQGLSTIPVLTSEYNASEYAKKFPGVDKALLDETYKSYLINKVGNRLAIPALSYLGLKVGENW